MVDPSPKFSIITVCFNAKELIEKTVQSVLAQTYPHIEYIIIDGGSTDGTLAIVNKYAGRISRIVSEPDNGIYDAMNKGIRLSTGGWLYFPNAGDTFVDTDLLARVAAFLAKHASAEIIYGDIQRTNLTGQWVTNEKTYAGEIKDKRYLFTNMFCQQRAFIKRTVFEELGEFDISYKVIADYDLIFRAYQKGREFAYLGTPVISAPLGGYSNLHLDRFLKERLRTLQHLPWWQRYWILDHFAAAIARGSGMKYLRSKLPK